MRERNLGKSIGIVLAIALFTWCFSLSVALSASVPGVTDDSILIGIAAPLSGPAALFAKQGSDFPESVFLEWGKNIHGRNIKLIKADEGCEPVKAVAAVKRLIYVDKVFLINGPCCSSSCLAAKPIVAQEGTPTLTSGGPADSIVNPVVKNLFNPGFSSAWTARSMVDFVMTVPGVKRVGVIHHTDEWGTAFYNPIIEHLKTKYNITPVVDVVTERGVADVTPQVLKLKGGNVDVILAPLYISETTAFLRDSFKLGLDVPIIGGTATSTTDQYESLKSLGPLKKYFSPYWSKYPLDHPKVKVYEDLFKKYHPEKKFDAQTLCAANLPLVILDALKRSGRDLTQEKFINVLETSYQNWEPDNYIGAGPLSFSKTDHQGMKKMVMSTIVTGKFEIVTNFQDYEKLVKK